MRHLWNVLGFLGLAHVVVALVLVLWLVQSGRLDADRAREIGALLARGESTSVTPAIAPPPVAPVFEPAPASGVSSAHAIGGAVGDAMREERAARRAEDEWTGLMGDLDVQLGLIEAREQALTAKEEAFAARLETERARREDEQFRQTVRLYESAPPRQAKAWLLTAMRAEGSGVVVGYLDAMKPQIASRILREFRSPEELKIAAGLLDDLRRHGGDLAGADLAGADLEVRR